MRLVFAGVNVLMLDSDCVMIHDWYKVPAAFPRVNMWTLLDHTSPANVNGGTYYVHGAHRHGPIMWALFNAVDMVRPCAAAIAGAGNAGDGAHLFWLLCSLLSLHMHCTACTTGLPHNSTCAGYAHRSASSVTPS